MKNKYIIFLGFGFELTGLIIGGLYLGGLYDDANKSNGLGRAIGAFAGLLLWCFHFYQANKKLEKEEGKER